MQRFSRRLTLVLGVAGSATLTLFLGPAWAALPEADPSADARVARLIEQLGDDQYSVRQHAKAELVRLGPGAFDALMAAEDHDDLEIAEQAKYLVRLIRVELVRDSDPQVVKSFLEDYDSLDAATRAEKVAELAALPQGEGLEALCRLVRFEKSSLLSKQAAAMVLNKADKMQPAAMQQREKLLEALDQSGRPGAKWLRAFVTAADNPQAAAEQWGKLADEEAAVLEHSPQQSGEYLVDALWRRQVEALKQAQRPSHALAVMRKIVQLEKGTPGTLASLVEWLAKEKAWELVGEVSTRFAATFDQNAMLLYTLAEARSAEGDKEAAEAAAKKAIELRPDRLNDHLDVARKLRNRGLFVWSEREYQKVCAEPLNAAALWPVQARLEFAEMLHDLEREKEAAETLQVVDEGLKSIPQLKSNLSQFRSRLESIESRMNFFYAEYYGSVKEVDKQKEHLNKAIKVDPRDADVLIALFNLPDQSPEERKRTSELIAKAVDFFRSNIEVAPERGESANNYNQMAWLIANTEGNFDEAVQASQKSLELLRADMPEDNPGGYLDTLAHCYFAKRDFDNAVRYQEQAVEHEPHSLQIRSALERFRAAQAKAGKP